MEQPSDAALVTRVCAGETTIFGELVTRYENLARVVALRYVPDHHSAEDIVQQSFVRAFEQILALRDHSKFSAWFTRIVQREAYQYLRRRQTAIEPANVDGLISPDSDALNEDFREAVYLLNQLPSHERIVMSLHYLDGQTVSDIARITGRPIGTVTKQLSRGMKRVQALAQRRERQHAR